MGMRLKEGQGWLEEMYIVSGLINEMTSQLPTQLAATNTNTDTTVESVIKCLRKAHSIFNGLLVRIELYFIYRILCAKFISI